MAKHRKGKSLPFHIGRYTNKRFQPTNLLCILALRVRSSSAEPMRGIVTWFYIRLGWQDVNVYMVRLLKAGVLDGLNESQWDAITSAMRGCLAFL